MPSVIVTTSWDDGHMLDERLATLLLRYDLPATLYVAPKDREFPQDVLLTAKQVRKLSKDFEIGAHTIHHPELTAVRLEQAETEIVESKKALEEIVEKPIETFCYPRGKYNEQVASLVRKAGFLGARTIHRFQSKISDPFEMPTTVQAYSHYTDIPTLMGLMRFNPLKAASIFSWESLAIYMFESILQTGGIFHFWGHSWETDKRHEWDMLERIFKYLAHRSDVTYLTNKEVLQQYKESVPLA